jgi:hypothetical protein
MVDSFQQRLIDIESAAVDQVNSAMDRLQTQEMKSALKTVAGLNLGFPDQLPNLDAIAKDAADVIKNVQKAQDARKQAMTQLRVAVSSFAKG